MIGTSSGTSTAGNTNGCVFTQKRRNYFITFWDQAYKHYELPKGAQFLIECDDQTLEGQWHGHAFIYFKNPIAFSTIKKLFGATCHVEIPQINSKCIAYVRGEITHDEDPDATTAKTNIREFGVIPMDNGIKRTVADLKKMESPDELDWNMHHTWMQIHARDKIKTKEWHKSNLEVYYFWTSKSGGGKSKAIQDWLDEHNIEEFDDVKHVGDFWLVQGDGTGVAVYDEFRDSHMPVSEFINFIDYNMHSLNIKGGSLKNRYTTILISSIQDPRYIYSKMTYETRQQWLRRIHLIHITQNGKIEIPCDSGDSTTSSPGSFAI